MLNATMESSSGSYQYDQYLDINKTMVNTLRTLLCTVLVMYLVLGVIVSSHGRGGGGSEERKVYLTFFFSSTGECSILERRHFRSIRVDIVTV